MRHTTYQCDIDSEWLVVWGDGGGRPTECTATLKAQMGIAPSLISAALLRNGAATATGHYLGCIAFRRRGCAALYGVGYNHSCNASRVQPYCQLLTAHGGSITSQIGDVHAADYVW